LQQQPKTEKQDDMKPRPAAMVIALAAIPVLAGPVRAASTLVFTAVPARGPQGKGLCGRVYAGSQGVLTLGGRGRESVAEAEEVARRLNALVEEGVRPDDVAVRRQRRSHVILARGRAIVTVDRALASLHHSDPSDLAQTWAQNLRAQFSAPYLAVREVLVPVGESRAVPVKGNPAGPLSVRAEGDVVSAALDRSAGVVRVTGLRVGTSEIIVSDGQNVLGVPVRSAKYAARLLTTSVARVTGNPATAEVIERAVAAAVGASLALEPGAWADVSAYAKAAPPLLPGQTTEVPVRISAAGEEYIPYRARQSITVRNEPVQDGPVDVLMVSNSPERILSHGMWFEGRLADGESSRLLFHHVNGTKGPADLVIELWNLGEQASWVHAIAGVGGPSYDEAWAGHRAALTFLANRYKRVGWVVPVPARTAVPIASYRMGAGSTLSGVVELRALGSADLRVRLYLSPHRASRMPHPTDGYLETAVLGANVYPTPKREVTAEHIVGREWTFITIGNQALSGLRQGDRLAGNYGVIYEIALDLVNPTAQTAPVGILFESAGGPARGALLVDGRTVEIAALRPQSEALVTRYVLAPGERRRIHIETMPQGGSHYPVRLVARPI